MYVTVSQLVEMGVLPQEIEAKIGGGAWKTARPDPVEDGERRILLSSLPLDLQTKWGSATDIILFAGDFHPVDGSRKFRPGLSGDQDHGTAEPARGG